MSRNDDTSQDYQNLDVLVVGAGFSGLYQLHKLRKAGFFAKIFEAGSGLGGTWHWNCYPGARVDSESSIYQLSLEELWRDWNWTEKFPNQKELVTYFDYVNQKLDLGRDISLNTRVTSASFDKTTNRWSVHTDTGATARPRFLIFCTGFASKPLFPDLPGLDTFEGTVHHSALWPQEGVNLVGKRVGVIGTGASGVQIIQETGPVAAHLTVFQRTPNLALPMCQRSLSEVEQTKMKQELYPILFKRRRQTFAGFPFDVDHRSLFDVSAEERYLTFDEQWTKGGFQYWLGAFQDTFKDEKANEVVYAFWRKKVLERVRDPEKQRKLAPEKSPHPFGTKRPSLEQHYYEVFNRLNVTLVDLQENPIVEVTRKGVKTQDGAEHELDVLALATGFDAVTGSMAQIDIIGTDRATIKDKWEKGLSTYLGLAVSGFPNMFFTYGPHGPTAFCNGPTCLEIQSDWIVECLTYMRDHRYTRVDATQEAEQKWVQRVAEIFSDALWDRAKSWYTGANVPGKPVESLNFTGGVPLYTSMIQDCAKSHYAGFEFTGSGTGGSAAHQSF